MTQNSEMLRPFYYRHPWYFLIFSLIISVWLASTYALGEGFLPVFLLERDGKSPTLLAGLLWMAWTVFLLFLAKRIGDPMAWKLPHAELIITAMGSLLESYDKNRRDLILARLQRAGEMGFGGGPGKKKYEMSRISVSKVREHSEGSIDEVRRLQAVRSQSRLRIKYYIVASRIDDKELLRRKVDRFLRSKGVDPEDVAPTRPLPEQ